MRFLNLRVIAERIVVFVHRGRRTAAGIQFTLVHTTKCIAFEWLKCDLSKHRFVCASDARCGASLVSIELPLAVSCAVSQFRSNWRRRRTHALRTCIIFSFIDIISRWRLLIRTAITVAISTVGCGRGVSQKDDSESQHKYFALVECVCAMVFFALKMVSRTGPFSARQHQQRPDHYVYSCLPLSSGFIAFDITVNWNDIDGGFAWLFTSTPPRIQPLDEPYPSQPYWRSQRASSHSSPSGFSFFIRSNCISRDIASRLFISVVYFWGKQHTAHIDSSDWQPLPIHTVPLQSIWNGQRRSTIDDDDINIFLGSAPSFCLVRRVKPVCARCVSACFGRERTRNTLNCCVVRIM